MNKMENIIPHSSPQIHQEDITAVVQLLHSGNLAEGEHCTYFEQQFARFMGAKGAVATATGTHALALALMTLGIKENDYVIVPTYSCRALLDAILFVRAKPLLADCDDNYCIAVDDVVKLVEQYGKKIKALIAVNTFGKLANILEYQQFGIPIVEDCCQGFQWSAQNNLGIIRSELAIFSFHATKLLTTGEGGMVVSNNPELIQKTRQLKEGGEVFDSYHYRFMSPMTDMQAALGLSQLKHFSQMMTRRYEIAQQYIADLSQYYDIKVNPRQMFFRLPMKHQNVQEQIKKLQRLNVMAKKPMNPLLHHIYKSHRHFEHANYLFDTTISLPLYPSLTNFQVSRIIATVKEINENKYI